MRRRRRRSWSGSGARSAWRPRRGRIACHNSWLPLLCARCMQPIRAHSCFTRRVPAAVWFTSVFRPAPSALQEKAEAVRRKQMKHVLFTVPEVVEVSSRSDAGPAGWQQICVADGLVVRRPEDCIPLLLALPPCRCGQHCSSSCCCSLSARHPIQSASPHTPTHHLQAGEEVTVYYNPNNSALPGRNQIWIKWALRGSTAVLHGHMLPAGLSPLLRCRLLLQAVTAAASPGCSFHTASSIVCTASTLCSPPFAAPPFTALNRRGGWNRWRHPRSFGPLEMTPPKVGDHFQVRTWNTAWRWAGAQRWHTRIWCGSELGLLQNDVAFSENACA